MGSSVCLYMNAYCGFHWCSFINQLVQRMHPWRGGHIQSPAKLESVSGCACGIVVGTYRSGF